MRDKLTVLIHHASLRHKPVQCSVEGGEVELARFVLAEGADAEPGVQDDGWLDQRLGVGWDGPQQARTVIAEEVAPSEGGGVVTPV
ncbi:MAG: hypothetical protein ACREQ3_26115, partial [Candidatus Binatia bacterium]